MTTKTENQIDMDAPVEIIHNACGKSFWVSPADHLDGQGCCHCDPETSPNSYPSFEAWMRNEKEARPSTAEEYAAALSNGFKGKREEFYVFIDGCPECGAAAHAH